MGFGDYVKLFEKPAEDENLVEEGGEVTGGKVNEYEMRRNKNVEQNRKKLEELGLNRRPGNSVQQKKFRPRVLSNEDGSEYRCPKNKEDPKSNDEEDFVSSKRKKKGKRVVVGTHGLRTRSRASKMSHPSDKQVNAIEENDASEVPIVEKLKLLKNNATGSMAAYLQLREHEKQAEMEILPSQSQPENLQSQPD
ncbi:hypothetical protein POM88_028715 [Heracleum sosnowskyi]|uniref:Uncharacterized protein n=1 Tax=Heracleum sosnowskyi TaxID=360622 RepID=A0AAD8HU50_9APIA|nr:hypothetical protein POM88_028715 [Heracleum sosnowskyi]